MHAGWNCRNLLLWVGLEFWIAGFNAAKLGGLGEEGGLKLRFLCGFGLFCGVFRWWVSQIWCLVRHSEQCRDAIVLLRPEQIWGVVFFFGFFQAHLGEEEEDGAVGFRLRLSRVEGRLRV